MAECLKSVLELVELVFKSVLESEVGVELYSKTNQYFVPEESVKLELEEMIDQTFSLLLPEQKVFSGEKISDKEKDFFCNLLTDYTVQDIALLASRTAASADGFHRFENRKFEYWYNRWAIV